MSFSCKTQLLSYCKLSDFFVCLFFVCVLIMLYSFIMFMLSVFEFNEKCYIKILLFFYLCLFLFICILALPQTKESLDISP